MQRPNPETITLSDILSTEGLSHAFISNLPGAAVFVVDRDLRYLLAEGEALAISGFKPEDFVGRTIFEALPPELAASYEPMYRQALAGEPFEDEHQAHGHTYISRGTPLRSDSGEIYAVLVVSYDISDRKQSEAALRESEARLRSIANLVPDLLWDSEPDGSTNWYNGRWMEYTGQTVEQSIGWGWIDAIHPDDREESARRYREAVEKGVMLQQEHRIRRHDGAYRWFVINAFPLKDERGQVIKMYGSATDIHEQRVALEALRESEAKYRTLFNAMEEGFCSIEVVYDEGGQPVDHRILEANPAFERHTGLTDMQGRLASELMPGVEQFWNDLYARVVATGKSERLEQYSSAFDRWFDVEISRIEDESLRRVALIFQDISDRKQAEVALRESEARLALELADARQLQFISSQLLQEENVDVLYEQILEAAITLMRSDMGSMQMLHPDRNELQLLAWKGFDPASAAFWEWVRVDSESTCGMALRTGERAIVPDVETCELMVGSGDLDSYRLSGVRAVQTTPLISRKGQVVGMISTHWQEPHQPAERELGLLDVLARQAADLIEQRQAEAALRESEERLRLALSAGEMGTWQYRFATNEHILDPTMRQLLGLPPGTDVIPLADFLHIVHVDDRPQVRCEIERALHEGGEIDLEFRVVWQDGSVIWLKDRGKAIRGEDDRPLFLTGAAIDITQRKQAEVALQESEKKYRSLFESIDEGFCTFEMVYNEAGEAIDFRYIETNPAFERQSGRRPQPGQTMRELFPEAEDMWLKDYAEVARTGQAKRFIDHHKDLDRWFDVFVFPTSNGKNQLAALFSDVTDEKRSEAALRESEERLQKALSIETVGVLFFRLDGRITDANDTFLAMSGYSRDELRNIADWQELTPPEFWDVTSGATEELATLGTTAPYEKQHIRRDGSRWWGLFSPTRLKGGGRNAECVEFVIDISDRKQAEAQLSRAAEMDAFRVKLTDALRSLADPVEIQSEAARVIGEHLDAGRAAYAEIEADGAHFTIHRDYTNGVPSFAGYYPNDSYGAAFFADLRAGRSVAVADAERNARMSEAERVTFAAGMVRAAVAVPLNKGGRLAAIFFLHFPVPHEWPDDEVALVEETAERTWAAVERARAEAALRESELQRVREQSAREQERQRAESLAELDRAKTTFFSNVSHEFRTPLTLSLAPLQDALSDRTHPLDPVHRERLELVHRNSLRLLKLVNTLLDFSRIEAGRMEAVYEPTDLATYTAELASVFRSAIERAGLQLMVDCSPLPEPVFVDREMWEKIVLNLLSNAFKFTFEGEIRVSLHATDCHQAILQIQDTGTGIAPEHLPHLFERFYQVRGTQARTHEGSGIGLALVNELVQLQGGTIEVSSTVGEGTCFTIALPFGTDHLPSDRLQSEGDRYPVRTLASTAMGATAYVEEAERWVPEGNGEASIPALYSLLPTPPSARVLVVDDNADMREYLTRILSEHVQVEAVADGVTALAVAQERVPDLILSDVMMPGLDGFELLQALRADPRTREIPIILLSARAGEEAIVEGLEAGADDYLIKPFSAQELISRVTAHLQMAQLRGEALQEARSTLRSRDEFISVVSHELNTPLVSILGWTRMLRSSPPNPVMLSKALDTIERNATLQGKLVQDLLDLSRITAGKLRLNPQPIELQLVIETAIATVTQTATDKGIHLAWQEKITEPVVVMGDSDRLSQVLINLLTNAIKFTPESGSVTLKLFVINTDGSADASYAEIRVADTGDGISADFLPYVFDRFRQADGANAAKGLGLGLAIARHIVELHNGTIHIESAGEGQGATFIVRLPFLQKRDDLI